MSSFGSNAGMETFTPLINAMVNNTLFHSNSIGCRLNSFTFCVFVVRIRSQFKVYFENQIIFSLKSLIASANDAEVQAVKYM